AAAGADRRHRPRGRRGPHHELGSHQHRGRTRLARLPDPLQPRRPVPGVQGDGQRRWRGQRRPVRSCLPDLPEHPNRDGRGESRSGVRLLGAADGAGHLRPGGDPAERHHLCGGGRGRRQQRERERAKGPIRDADQDAQLLRRLSRPDAPGGGDRRFLRAVDGSGRRQGHRRGAGVVRGRLGRPGRPAAPATKRTPMRRPLTLGATLLAALVGASPTARAQDFATEASLVESDNPALNPYRTPQRFAFELTFGPYQPDIDGEFNGARTPYKDYFGSGQHLLTRAELDYQFWHRYGSVAAGLGVGYFSVTGTAPVANGTGLPSGDKSELKVVPLSLSAVYRFDYFLETRKFPLVPFGKIGFDWAYWQITDGNGNIAEGDGGH